MARPSRNALPRLLEGLKSAGPPRVDEAEFARLAAALPEFREGRLRAALRASGLPLAPWVEGVRQDSLADLERTLAALAGEYAAGDTARRRALRALVITSKTHAQWALRRAPPERREFKAEVLLWIRTWLENPPVFPVWAELRGAQLATRSQSPRP
jgi:hypothetical protein